MSNRRVKDNQFLIKLFGRAESVVDLRGGLQGVKLRIDLLRLCFQTRLVLLLLLMLFAMPPLHLDEPNRIGRGGKELGGDGGRLVQEEDGGLLAPEVNVERRAVSAIDFRQAEY